MARIISLTAVFAASLVMAASTAAAPPAGTSVQIEQHATLVAGGVMVSVDLQCPAGTTSELEVQVQQGASTGEFFQLDAACTGAKQQETVLVPGVFTPGAANAGAGAIDNDVFSLAQDQRVITIS
jgi:hypothetical protein